MLQPTKNWFHITVTTYGAWLDGDPRGFEPDTIASMSKATTVDRRGPESSRRVIKIASGH